VQPKQTLFLQLGILAICGFVVTELLTSFPFPSPVIKPLLPPRLRWPSEQVARWVEAGNFEPGFLEYFARDPERTVPPGHNLTSPADGVIKDIITQNGVSYFIIGLSFWDVHVVRTPVAGVVKRVEQEGFSLFQDKSETEDQIYLKGKDGPVQQIVTLDTEYGEVKVRLITSYWASRIKVRVYQGERLEKGQRIGRILLGSSVVAELPANIAYAVKKRDRIIGGETIISNGVADP
jgi:phosphatidylserine decarboxylase